MITYCGLKMHLLMRQLTNVASSVCINGFLTSGILKAMFQEGKGGNRKLSGALDFIDMSFLPYSISQTSYKVRPGSKYGKLIPFLD